jgi:hypothetical protein
MRELSSLLGGFKRGRVAAIPLHFFSFFDANELVADPCEMHPKVLDGLSFPA